MANHTPAPGHRSGRAKLNCQRVTALIQDYLTGELNPQTALVFRGHLRTCPDCVAFVNTYKKTIHAVRSLQYREIPPELRARARRFLQERMKGFPPSR